MNRLTRDNPQKPPGASRWKRLVGLGLSTVILVGAVLGMGVLLTAPANAATDGAGNTSSGSFTTELSRCPSEPLDGGRYVLTENLTAGDGPCLILNGSVTVDGNGHAIVGPASGFNTYPIVAVNLTGARDFPTIFPPPAAYSGVTVRNVTIVDWSEPMLFQNMTDSTIEDVTVKDSKGIVIRDGENNQVRDTRIIGGEFTRGLTLEDTVDAEVTQTTIRGVDFQGLAVYDQSSGITIKESTIVNNGNTFRGSAGIQLGSTGSPGAAVTRIRDNTIRSNGDDGIEAGRSARIQITNNTITGNTDHAIDLSDGNNNTISDNLIRQNSRGGIRVEVTNSTVLNNIVETNDNDGIVLNKADHSVIQNNTVRRNDGHGIKLNNLNNVTVRNNIVTNHTDPGLKLDRGDTIDIWTVGNVLRDNHWGIRVSGGGLTSGTIERNRLVNNSKMGIEFINFRTGVDLFDVDRNVIAGNGNYGIKNENDEADVDATNNWWGAMNGPSSLSGENLTDPVTGAAANGSGQAVSENGSNAGVSNVHFDPWLESPPELGIGEFDIVTAQVPRSALDEPVTHQIAARGGTPPVESFEVVNGSLPPGMNLTDDGVLSGTPTTVGNFTFTIRATDSDNATASVTLTKRVSATVPRADIDIEKVGSGATPGRKTLYLIHVKNTGSTIARDVPVDEYLEPWFTYTEATPKPDNITTAVVRNGTAEEIEALVEDDVDFEKDLTKSTLSWTIDELRPGESRLLTYQVRLDSRIPDGYTVSGEACSCSGGCCENYNRCKQEVVAGCALPGSLGRGLAIKDCLTVDITGCLYGLFGPDPEQLCQDLGDKGICRRDYEACRAFFDATPRKIPCGSDETNVTTATDPNEKLVAADRYIQPTQTLPYTVHFENIGNATATNVTVTDRLPDELNRSSVEVFTADRTRKPLQAGQPVTLLRQNQTRTLNITLDNGTTITRTEIVTEHHTATLDDGTLRWHLENIDLAPNETGTLLLSVTPKKGLPDGTRIENNATIQFDDVSSLTTNDTVNIIDSVAPTCSVDPLPAQSPRTISLSWTGSDPVGEIEDVTIFQSTDGNTWEVADVGLEDNTTTVEAVPEKTYRFMCVAEDTAGNRETQSGGAEATTTVPTVDIKGTVREADGEPAAGDTVTFADAPKAGNTGAAADANGAFSCGVDTVTRVMTGEDGQFSVTSEVKTPKNLAYYQTRPGQFTRGEGSPPDGSVPFPRDGSPDVFGLDRLTPSEDRNLGDVTLPQAHLVNVTVVTESGQPVENASVAVSHTGEDGAKATLGIPNATNANGLVVPAKSDGPGLELTGDVTVAVRPPTSEDRFVDRRYMRNLTVASDRTVRIEVETRDADPPQIRQFNRSQPSQAVTPGTPATVRVNLTDANPGEATLTIRPVGSDEVAFQQNVSDAFDGSETVDWDGTDATGTALAEGQYEIELQATDAFGLRTSSSLTVVVDPDEADTGTGTGGDGGAGSFLDDEEDGTPAGATPEAPSTPEAGSTPDGTPADGDSDVDATPAPQQDDEGTPEQVATSEPGVTTPQQEQEPGGFGGPIVIIGVLALIVAGGAGIYFLRQR